MAAAAVLRPSSHSSSGRQAASMLGTFRPRTPCRTTHAEAVPLAQKAARRPSERRGQTPGRKPPFPEAAARASSRSTVSSGLAARASGTSAAGSAGGVSRRPPSTTFTGSFLGGGQTGAARAAAAASLSSGSTDRGAIGSRTGDGGTRSSLSKEQPPERRKSAASIRAGMMVASSNKSLGEQSNASSSPRSSNQSTSDACQETGEEGSVQQPPGSSLAEPADRRGQKSSSSSSSSAKAQFSTSKTAVSTQKMQVPAGVEEDFESCNWLSDASIAFANSCLQSSGGSSSSSSNFPAKRRAFPKNIMFMDPAMAFWLTMQEDTKYIAEAKAELKLHELDLLLCPINDTHTTSTADAGCHWSLLVCWGNGRGSSRRPKGSAESQGALSNFRYYDSLGGLFAEKGVAQAEELANRMAGKTVRVEIGECAQQTNFYDCGIYVLLYSEIIARAYVDSRSLGGASHVVTPLTWEERLLAVTPEEVDACRTHYHSLAKEGTQQ